jgi:hypothetical protein
MSSRFGIAAQALGVAALGVLVYFAFLQPSDPNPLSGVEVDGTVPAGTTPGNEAVGGRRSAQSRARARAGARRGAGPLPLAAIRLVPVTPGEPPPLSGPPTLADDETPTGSQYDSAVARVLGRIARTQP